MPSPVLLVLVFVAAYLVGAIPFGYLIARAKGVDILAEGSGNIGATNVSRVLGRTLGILVFVLDLAKGAIPVFLAYRLPQPADLAADLLPVTAGVGTFLGHLFPVYLRFRGGKGVATGAGVVLVLLPGPVLLVTILWLAIFATTRTVSLASILAAGMIAVYRPLMLPAPWDSSHVVVTGFCLVAAILIVVRHLANVRRLFAGKENAFPESPAMTQLGKILHVLGVGLWFGTLVCFSVVGFLLFETMEELSSKPQTARPYWFKIPPEMDLKESPSPKFPFPLGKEQGSRVAGYLITPMFRWFFATQVFCGVVALLTALAWRETGTGRARILLLLVALGTAAFGWGLEIQVNAMRDPRNLGTDTVLMGLANNQSIPADQITFAEEARARFGMWHGISMLLNLLTLLLVFPVMILCAMLPSRPTAEPPPPINPTPPTPLPLTS